VESNQLSQEEFDVEMMDRALELAAQGGGFVSPNPLVGAVIVDEERRIIGEGWHKRFGGPHAEINALSSAEGRDLSGATMYVTLEPCSHYGKTPPCAEAVIASGIRRVVIAMRDPNQMVNGRGIKILREAGIDVTVGVREAESRELNESYLHFIATGTPFITIKVAQTLDGFTALPNGESKWITGVLALERAHRIRALNDAIMIGKNTALKDDPTLTIRYGIESRPMRRIVLDETLDLPSSLKLFTDEHREMTTVFTSESQADSPRAIELRESGVDVAAVPIAQGGLKMKDVFAKLGAMNITSVMVEGGATLHVTLLANSLVHKLLIFIAPKLLGHGIKVFNGLTVEHLADAYRFDVRRMEMVGEDTLLTAYWHKG
jgi:diaminohydroxyphosphoribosylaminopyrimidine deaminase/5-amino-6-(5-phosphoribosylamino)uracil reductase